MQEIQRELFVVGDIEPFYVELREDVEACLRFHRRHARNAVERFVDEIALLQHAAARRHVALDALMTAQRCLDDGLARRVRAHAHVAKHVDAFDVVLGATLVAGQDHPADAIARYHMRFRQAAERDAEQVRSKRSGGDMLQAVHDQTVVNLVREDQQVVLAGNGKDLFQDLFRVERAGRVVRVDDDDGLGARRHLAADVVNVRVPFLLFVADIMDRRTTRQVHARCPQGIVRRGNEHFVSGVHQRRQADIDELGDAVARVDVAHGDVRNMFHLRILHDGLARRE